MLFRSLTPRRRCQPSNGATRAEPVFPTKREGPARRRRRHAMVVEALVPPDAARVAIRIATRDATVYTNAPKRHREAILADLCTLLRPHGCPQQRNSVHKCPKMAPRGHFHRFVYTIAFSRLSTTAQQPNSVHKCPKTAPRGHSSQFVYTLALRCLMRVPLAATEWQADRALDATVWHESRYMRSCQEMSCHSTPSSGTTIAHSVTASGTTEPRKAGVSQNASSWRPG